MVIVAGLVLALVASCARGNDPTPRPPASFANTTRPAHKTCRPTEPVPPNNQVHSITYRGVERTYVLSVPPGYDGTSSVPLIFDFYGRQGDAEVQVADFELDDQATAAGMLVVTPQAAPDRDMSKNAWSTDIGLVTDILASLEQKWCIDSKAIYTAGFSDGGVFAAYLACELPDRFAAVGIVAEADFPPNCPSRHADFSVIGFQGESDPLVPFGGGSTDDDDGRSGLPGSPSPLTPSAPIETTFADFAKLNSCRTDPIRTAVTPDVDRLVYPGCGPGLAVELYVVASGGHEWPGDPGAAPPPPGAIDANHLMIEFFLAHPNP